MGWKFWKRDTDDPLAKSFFERHRLHLLSLPREDVAVCDLYIHDDKGTIPAGPITKFLTPPYMIPEVRTGEQMPDVSGVLSNQVDARAGISFLEAFLSAFGIQNLIGTIKGEYQSKGVKHVRFRFPKVTRDYASVIDVADNLIGHKIRDDLGLAKEGRKYYIVTAVVRTSSINTVTEDDSNKAIDVTINTPVGNGAMAVGIQKKAAGEIIFDGTKNLGFGVELFELDYMHDSGTFSIEAVKDRLGGVRDTTDLPEPALIGDAISGDIFI